MATIQKAKAVKATMKQLKVTSTKLADLGASVDPLMEAIETFIRVNPDFKVIKRDRDRATKLIKAENDRTGRTIFEGITADVMLEEGTREDIDREALQRDLGENYKKYLKTITTRELKVIPKRA